MAKRASIVGQSGRPWPRADGGGRRQVLETLLGERRRTPQEPPAARAAGADPIDAAQEREEEMVHLAVLDRTREIQTQVDEALHRLAGGRYGLCADCGEPIQSARLRALPFAVRCLPCQERIERGAKDGAAAATAGAPRQALGLAGRHHRRNGIGLSGSTTRVDGNGEGWA